MTLVAGIEGRGPQDFTIPPEVPILPSGGNVLYPSIVVPVVTSDEMTVRVVDDAMAHDKIMGIFSLKDPQGQPTEETFNRMGTAAVVARMMKLPDGSVHALVQGLSRLRLVEFTQTQPIFRARVEVIAEHLEKTTEVEAAARNLVNLFQQAVQLAPNLPQELAQAVAAIQEPGVLADFVAAHINLSPAERQEVLETLDVAERLRKVSTYINRELEILELGSKIQSEIKGEMDRRQREFYLREQLRAIQKELGETDERGAELSELRAKIEDAGLPPEAKREAERELDRLSRMSPAAADYGVARTYLDWLLSLPWNKSTEDRLDIAEAKKVLDEDHYNLEKAKDRILDYLAVLKLKQDLKGPILCLVGPPGTGKTSIGKSVARALGRNFIRMSLGGIRDEAEIRGFRRTYVGALPGRILQEIRRAGSNNPVFMLDEIDKVGADFRGDPSAALLEVLDPEQNNAFVDHYLDVPFDLSKVMFITTANLMEPVIPALRDRMEVIELSGYTEQEKLHIATGFLVPKQARENGIDPGRAQFSDEAILGIIQGYTREAGVRNLERNIATIFRKVARRIASGEEEITLVRPDDLHGHLGPRRFRYEAAEGADEVGVATGLAWTPVGGEVLFIEATVVPGRGGLTLTGKLGDVMQESAKAAITYARSRASALGIPQDFYAKNDIHIHIPAGAIPKDGPSAGITMATALISALTKRPVDKSVGMTGEITLRGKVMPIGGLKDKVLAAHRAGVKTIVLPKENQADLEEVPQQIRDELRFVFVEHMDEVLKAALRGRAESQEQFELAPVAGSD